MSLVDQKRFWLKRLQELQSQPESKETKDKINQIYVVLESIENYLELVKEEDPL